MAERPVYKPSYDSSVLVSTELVEFKWFPGMAISQKMKSVDSLHSSAIENNVGSNLLEISSKSREKVGIYLSAFNLTVETNKKDKKFTVETAFQSSKVFKNGGPYIELLYGTSIAAKKDPRLKASGPLISFLFNGEAWPTEPKTAFYDWLYLNALDKNPWAVEKLLDFDAFTDIEFNPKKSINCQAYSVALYMSLQGRGILKDALRNQASFLELIGQYDVSTTQECTHIQPQLL